MSWRNLFDEVKCSGQKTEPAKNFIANESTEKFNQKYILIHVSHNAANDKKTRRDFSGAMKYQMSYKCVHVIASNSWLTCNKMFELCWFVFSTYYSYRGVWCVRACIWFYHHEILQFVSLLFSSYFFSEQDHSKKKWNEMKRNKTKKKEKNRIGHFGSLPFGIFSLLFVVDFDWRVTI